MGSGLRSKGKKDAYKMPLYTTSIEEEKWHKYCMDNIIIKKEDTIKCYVCKIRVEIWEIYWMTV